MAKVELKTHGVYISSGKISAIITNDVTIFEQEKKDIVDAGIQSTAYQHLDDTGSRVNGKNHHTHILCNPFFTAFTTLATDELFSKKTDYQDLDERIASTFLKKEKLLLVLQFHDLPLHNNPAELGARVQARKRDVSLQTKTPKGTKSKDYLMTINETAKKLCVNTYHYFCDRTRGRYEMPSLADLIRQRSGPYLKPC
jgi:hypothetical protein